jgi:hypothetical protein
MKKGKEEESERSKKNENVFRTFRWHLHLQDQPLTSEMGLTDT